MIFTWTTFLEKYSYDRLVLVAVEGVLLSDYDSVGSWTNLPCQAMPSQPVEKHSHSQYGSHWGSRDAQADPSHLFWSAELRGSILHNGFIDQDLGDTTSFTFTPRHSRQILSRGTKHPGRKTKCNLITEEANFLFLGDCFISILVT